MNAIQLAVASFTVLIFSLIGFAFVIDFFIKKLNKLQKPRTPLRANPKLIKEFMKLTKNLSLEEKLFTLELQIGSYQTFLSVTDGEVSILALGRNLRDTRDIEYAR